MNGGRGHGCFVTLWVELTDADILAWPVTRCSPANNWGLRCPWQSMTTEQCLDSKVDVKGTSGLGDTWTRVASVVVAVFL